MDTSKNNLDDYSSDEFCKEENNDICDQLSSMNNSGFEEDGDCSDVRQKLEELALLKPSTSGISSNFYKIKSSTQNKTLQGLTDQDDDSSDEFSDEESSDDSCEHLSRENKRSNEDHESYPFKRLRKEDPELDEPSTSGIRSTYKVKSSTLHGHQDDYSWDTSSYEEGTLKKLKLDEASTSGRVSNFYNVESSAPKKTLHGNIYQLRLLMLFVQRVPDEQEFYLSTEMHEAGLFDDIVLQYLGDGIWRYRFLQAKHKNDDHYKIGLSDLFNKKTKSGLSKNTGKKSQSSKNAGETKPYLLKKYFKSYCDIEQKGDFKNANLEEFLICTNVGFDDEAKIYFECAEKNDPVLLNFKEINEKGTNLITYRLTAKEKQISELRKEFEINSKNENCFLNFCEKFRFLPNYGDDIINNNIKYCLKKCFKIENVDLADAALQKRVLEWFQSYKDKKSRYLRFKDKKEFFKSLNINIDSLLVAGCSTFYFEELKSCGEKFKNILLLREFFDYKKEDKIMFIITATPKLSIIKLCQLFEEFELRQDEFILTNADKLRTNKKISTIFFSKKSYKWLVIEYHHNEIKLSRKVLNQILELDKGKTVVIIGREDHILNFRLRLPFDTPYFYDKNNLFKNLTEASQKKILEKQIIFQEEEISLNKLIDINSGIKIINDQILEKLHLETIKIENNNVFKSHFLIEDCYIPRKLIRRKLSLDILKNEELLKCCLFIISDVDRDQLKNLNINNEWIFLWKKGKIYTNGIILCNKMKIEDIFKKICKNNTENICWLKHVQGKFLIMNLRNDTDILRKNFICLDEGNLNEDYILKKKILIIADGPGCGKSMFMTRVAHQLKQKLSNVWVLRINLTFYAYKQDGQKQVMKSLEDIQFGDSETDKAIEFMVDLLFHQENENQNKYFVRELFAQSLYRSNENMKFPKIILLFDGFDEISPTFKEKTLALLQALLNSNVTQMWITTRNHEEHSLEMALHSSSFFLRPLDFTEKVEFLQKLWKYNLMNFNNIKPKPDSEDVSTYLTEITNNICNCDNNLINYSFKNFQNRWLPTLSSSKLQHLLSNVDFSNIAEHLINYFEYSYEDKISEFTGNPLQLNMIAEITVFRKFSSLDKLDRFSLYGEFIKYKLRVFRDDKDAAGKSVAGRGFFETHLEYLTTVHQEIAFQILFPQHDNKQFRKAIDKIELSRAGLLVIYEDRLEFVHRSFAEYFASQYFAKDFELQQIQEIVFSEVLVKENYSIIRKFLNSNTKFLKKLSTKSPQMNEIIRVNSSNLLNQMLKEELYNLFIKFLENLPPDLSEDAILFNKHVDGTTVLHTICNLITDERTLENILKTIKDSVSSETLIKLFFKTDNQERTALHCINFDRGQTLIVKQKLQFFKLNCTSELFYKLLLQVNEEGETILHHSCKVGYDIIYLLEVSDENRDAVRELLLKIDNKGETALSITICFSYNPSLLTTLLNLVKSVCSSEEIIKIFAIKNYLGNLLHAACKQMNEDILVILLNAITDNKEMIKPFLLDTDEKGRTPLHYTVYNFCHFDMLKILLDFVKLNCSKETLHTLLCKRTLNRHGTTMLHMAVETFKITSHGLLTHLLTYLFNLVKNSKEIFYELLLTSDKYGRTVLYYISSQFLLKELLDFVETNCSATILNELLLKLNDKNRNILYYICYQNNEQNLTILLNKIKDNPETLNKLLLQTDKEGNTALHYTLLNCENPSMISALLNFVKINCEKEIFKNLLCQANNKGLNVLHVACMKMKRKREYEEKLISLLKFIEDDDTILNELLLKTCNSYCCTPLHYTVLYFDNPSLLKILFVFIKKYDSTMLNTLLLQESYKGCSLLHFACKHNNEESLKYLLYALQDNVALRDILILKAAHKEQTMLHYSVDNLQMLKFLLDFVKSYCSLEIFTNLILKCDQEGRTGLHTFCQIDNNKETLTYLLNSIKDNTTPEIFNTFLSIKDCHGKVASDYIACNANSSSLLEVLSTFNLQLPKIIDNSQ